MEECLSPHSPNLSARAISCWKVRFAEKDIREKAAGYEFTRWCAFQRSNGYTSPKNLSGWQHTGLHDLQRKEDLRLPSPKETAETESLVLDNWLKERILSYLDWIGEILDLSLTENNGETPKQEETS